MGGRVSPVPDIRRARGIPTATVRAGDADNNLRSVEPTREEDARVNADGTVEYLVGPQTELWLIGN